jgi:carbon catabolite-derepressing protein kinase
MAPKPFEDEELSISLSPSQIRRTSHAKNPEVTVTSHGGGGIDEVLAGHLAPDMAVQADKIRSTDSRMDQYTVLKTLGEGSFGKVKLAIHKSTGQKVALKIISRKKLISRDMTGRVEREIEFLQLLRHPHIIKLLV